MKKSSKLNPPLNVGGVPAGTKSIIYGVPAGTKGVVTRISEFFIGGQKEYHYSVDWENGSTLSILSDVDSWALSSSLKIKESISENEHPAEKIANIIDDFKFGLLRKFLSKLRNSGIINMFGSAPYLYMGKERIESIHKFDPISESNEEEFNEMLDLADKSKDEMIRGTVKILEKSGKEWDIDDVNRDIAKNAQKVLQAYMATYMI